MARAREVEELFRARAVREGAGVRLKRAVGFGDVTRFDPFLLLDDIHSSNPDDYIAGFPWHPHRGIETVTYVLRGAVEHGDSIGNKGVIRSGEVQWMTAGSGIIHQEMPHRTEGELRGLQLWVNLPRSHKMMAPRYREIETSAIPESRLKDGTVVKVIAGLYEGLQGPMQDIVRSPEYFDVTVQPGGGFTHRVPGGHTVFAYVLTGSGAFGPGDGKPASAGQGALLGRGDLVSARARDDAFRFLLFAGEPLGEPIAWRGPMVMNTEEELDIAFEEYRNGTFIKG